MNIKLTTVNKIALLNNIGFSNGEKNSVLYYMNTMSSKGLHIKGFGVVRNGFVMDRDVRYIYAGCRRKNSAFFDDNSDWEHVLDRFGTAYYRKKLPQGYCTFDESFLNDREEEEWLYDRMDDGYLLCGVNSGEYIFEKIEASEVGAEYSVDICPDGESISDFLLSRQDEGWNFIAVSTDGKRCYFCRDKNYETLKRAERIKKSLKRATVSVAVCMASMAATLALTFWGIYTRIVSGDSAAGVFLIGGCAATVLGVLLLAEMSRRYMLSERYRRLMEKVSETGEFTAAEEFTAVIPETIQGEKTGRLCGAVITAVISVLVAVCAVFYCCRWFALGISAGYIMLTASFLCIAFFPFVLYEAIAVITDELKRK